MGFGDTGVFPQDFIDKRREERRKQKEEWTKRYGKDYMKYWDYNTQSFKFPEDKLKIDKQDGCK